MNVVFADSVSCKEVLTLDSFRDNSDSITVRERSYVSCSSLTIDVIIEFDHSLWIKSVDVKHKIVRGVSHRYVCAIR